ncbi:MAG TPA: DUF1192 domain-containing protein [Roseiarcus sp.]
MAALDDEAIFGAKPKPTLAHEIGQNIDDLSAPELRERIALLRSEIDRLEKAIEARQATRAAADSAFKI